MGNCILFTSSIDDRLTGRRQLLGCVDFIIWQFILEVQLHLPNRSTLSKLPSVSAPLSVSHPSAGLFLMVVAFSCNRLSYSGTSSTILKTKLYVVRHIFFFGTVIEQLAVEWDFGFKLSEWHTIFRYARVYGSDRDRTRERDLALSWSLFFFFFVQHFRRVTKQKDPCRCWWRRIFGRLDLSIWVGILARHYHNGYCSQ